MKEVSCNHAGECTKVEAAVFGQRAHWCHAATPHPVNEACERSYCREVRRQVQCEPVLPVATGVHNGAWGSSETVHFASDDGAAVTRFAYDLTAAGLAAVRAQLLEAEPGREGIPGDRLWPIPVPVTAPPDTCTRRVQGICDLSGIACAVVYDGVTCRRGRPPSPAEVAEADAGERRYEDARQVWAESQGADDLGKLRALAHDRDMKQRKVWHAFGRGTYRGVPVVKTDYLVPEAPATITARVYEESIRGIIFEAMRDGSRTGNLGKASRAVARIMKLPRIRQEGGE